MKGEIIARAVLLDDLEERVEEYVRLWVLGLREVGEGEVQQRA